VKLIFRWEKVILLIYERKTRRTSKKMHMAHVAGGSNNHAVGEG